MERQSDQQPELALQALNNAVHARRPRQASCITRTAAAPYASDDYATVWRNHGFIASMSRTGDRYDNAVVESFFGSLKAELPCDVCPSRVVAAATIADYIEDYYNPQRRHSYLDYVGPIEFELRAQSAAFAA